MSYSAHVYCNCLKEGKTKPYPFEFGFRIDDEGLVEPDLPETLTEEDRSILSRKRTIAIKNWMIDCCAHKHMWYAQEGVASLWDMARLRYILEAMGWEYFPALKQGLPPAYQFWSTSTALAKQILEELDFLKKQTDFGFVVALIDANTKVQVQLYYEGRQGIFRHHSDAGVDMGIDEKGFFITKRHQYSNPAHDLADENYRIQEPREELFRAMRFDIRKVEDGGIEYVNLDNHDRYVCRPGNGGVAKTWYLDREGRFNLELKVDDFKQFAVGTYQYRLEDVEYTVNSLSRMCEASIAIGNPICWVS